jgi:hypothetical protein
MVIGGHSLQASLLVYTFFSFPRGKRRSPNIFGNIGEYVNIYNLFKIHLNT